MRIFLPKHELILESNRKSIKLFNVTAVEIELAVEIEPAVLIELAGRLNFHSKLNFHSSDIKKAHFPQWAQFP